jgi:hypothetical protein
LAAAERFGHVNRAAGFCQPRSCFYGIFDECAPLGRGDIPSGRVVEGFRRSTADRANRYITAHVDLPETPAERREGFQSDRVAA